ncbi:MAG: aspartate aminotransferase family protein [Proteobacteria bacterium]|nr:aspartate aminotransferase family protein [Pseudomonadota bacterium]
MSFQPNSPAARDVAYFLHPYTNARAHEENGPMIITKGDGVYVYDDGGKQYLEAMAGLWCASLGFNESRLVKAATKQLETLPYYHTFAHKAHLPGIDLAEKLINLAPVPMSKVFFAGSGSEANDTAMKLVWYYNNALGRPEKKKIIARDKAYHGVTVAATSLTGLPGNQADFDVPLPGFLHTDCPHFYRNAELGESEDDFTTRLTANLEQMILDEGPETVAAFWAEPFQGAGGMIVPPKGYFPKIQAVLDKYDILFVADEVITGFCRTGEYWGSTTFDIRPDIVTCAKALSSAYMPIGAVLIPPKIHDAMVSQSEKLGMFATANTYSGHPVCAAVALKTLEIYEEREILAHVQGLIPLFQARLGALADHPLVGEARLGAGLVGGVELVADKETKEPFDPKLKTGMRVLKAAQEAGLLVRAVGDILILCPPLIMTSDQVDQMFDRLEGALDTAVTN